MRGELAKCDSFMVFVHHFTTETLEMLQIMQTEFPDKFNDVIQFRFGVDFKEEDLERLQTVLKIPDGKSDLFSQKRLSVQINKGRAEVEEIIQTFPSIYLLDCYENHLDFDSQSITTSIKRLHIKLKKLKSNIIGQAGFPQNISFMEDLEHLRIEQSGQRIEPFDCVHFPQLESIRYQIKAHNA